MSQPYGLLVRVSSNLEQLNMKTSLSECKSNKDNKTDNTIPIDVCISKRKLLRQFASVNSDAAKVT